MNIIFHLINITNWARYPNPLPNNPTFKIICQTWQVHFAWYSWKQAFDKATLSEKEIPFLAVDTIYIDEGYIWNTLVIYLQDGDVYQLGGINKSKSVALEKAFNDKKLTFLKRVAKNLSPMVNEAYIASKAFFRAISTFATLNQASG